MQITQNIGEKFWNEKKIEQMQINSGKRLVVYAWRAPEAPNW